MPYFHATAVFEVNGTSLEDADRTAGALFRSFRHRRVHYYEHDVTAGAAASPSSRVLHFSAIAEFDADAGSEERAGEMTEEALEALATDEVQFIAFGLTQGEPRVRPTERPEREEVEAGRQQEEARGEGEEDEERKGRKRSPRGRGRRRKNEREPERVHEEETAETATLAPEPSDSFQEKAEQGTPVREERVEEVTEVAAPIAAPIVESLSQAGPTPTQVEVREEVPVVPPPRSSASMRVTLTMSFRARELGFQTNGDGSLDQDEFLSRAIAEARARHPELPAETAPTHEIAVRPWGESVLTLTWAYDVPVPSASEDA
ncbi:MAG: hypothetical protein AB7P69_17150 [Candidatus Binatia bacterium]